MVDMRPNSISLGRAATFVKALPFLAGIVAAIVKAARTRE
jgi:hypothetical protein